MVLLFNNNIDSLNLLIPDSSTSFLTHTTCPIRWCQIAHDMDGERDAGHVSIARECKPIRCLPSTSAVNVKTSSLHLGISCVMKRRKGERRRRKKEKRER